MTARGQHSEEDRPGTFEFPEADAIAAQLDRARTAREKLDRTIAWLEEGLTLFAGDAPPPRPELPAAPARKPSTGPRSTGRNIEAKIIHVILNADAPLSRNEIAEQVGTSPAGVKNPLQRLVKAERIIGEGNTRNRVYRAAPRAPHTEHRARTDAGRERGAARLDAGVSRVGLRARVLNAIAAHPGITEVRIAELIEEERDDVAEATGWLLERDRIVLAADGTYRRNGLKEVAA